MDKLDKTIFKNKVVSFDTSNHITAIYNPKIKKIGENIFIVGTIPKGATVNEWAKGVVCALSQKHVENYIIFDSIDDYAQSTAKSKSN